MTNSYDCIEPIESLLSERHVRKYALLTSSYQIFKTNNCFEEARFYLQDNTLQYWQQLFNSINVVLVIALVYQLREKAALSHNFTNKVLKKMICIAVYTVDNAFQMM